MATFWSINVGSTKCFDYTFITDTQVDIEKTLPSYLSQKYSQCFDMLKSDISGLLSSIPCIKKAQCKNEVPGGHQEGCPEQQAISV